LQEQGYTFNNVVIAYVATLRFGSAMSVSKSMLQVATLAGCVNARLARVRAAANFRTGLGVVKKTCRTAGMIMFSDVP